MPVARQVVRSVTCNQSGYSAIKSRGTVQPTKRLKRCSMLLCSALTTSAEWLNVVFCSAIQKVVAIP